MSGTIRACDSFLTTANSPRLAVASRADYGGRASQTVMGLGSVVLVLVTALGSSSHTCGVTNVRWLACGVVCVVTCMVSALSYEGMNQTTASARAGGQAIMTWLLLFEVVFFFGAGWCYAIAKVTVGDNLLCVASWPEDGLLYAPGEAKAGLLEILCVSFPCLAAAGHTAAVNSLILTGTGFLAGYGLGQLLVVSLLIHYAHRLALCAGVASSVPTRNRMCRSGIVRSWILTCLVGTPYQYQPAQTMPAHTSPGSWSLPSCVTFLGSSIQRCARTTQPCTRSSSSDAMISSESGQPMYRGTTRTVAQETGAWGKCQPTVDLSMGVQLAARWDPGAPCSCQSVIGFSGATWSQSSPAKGQSSLAYNHSRRVTSLSDSRWNQYNPYSCGPLPATVPKANNGVNDMSGTRGNKTRTMNSRAGSITQGLGNPRTDGCGQSN